MLVKNVTDSRFNWGRIERIWCLLSMFLLLTCSGCKRISNEEPLFELLDHTRTGLDFCNTLTSNAKFNVFKYMYFYNGGGVAAGDFNNDGMIDLFFSANQVQNKLYLNTGGLHFKEVTAAAHIPQDTAWSTGVSVVDINNDGLLDIYICRVGNHEILHSHNQLLICKGIDRNGVPFYEDQAKQYGLDFSGYSTQAVFFDYDMDGDLDMFLLNHSVHENGSFRPRGEFLGTYNELAGDRIYRNDGGKFVDVTRQTGINSSAIGYGLGITVADINLDGYPDIYIGNDFHENDYLYINQRNGTFKEELTSQVMHTSQFSMGVDVADVNNDAYPEIISLDMMPSDPYILKRSEGENSYDVFNLKIRYGYNHQFSRNNLQLNRRNGQFSEVGFYSGVNATDWSWAALWMDFDNDGLKDLFISNGIPKRLNDIDYINYVSNEEIQRKIKDNNLEKNDMALIEKFPKIKIPNKFFKNNGDLVFNDQGKKIKNDKPSYSNGAVYADFDNDGDLDVVVNNIDEPAFLYENKSNNKKNQPFLQLQLKGPTTNVNAIGAKVILFANGGIRTYEKYPVRGFQSSMEIPLQIGLVDTKIDSMFIIWPDNTYEPFRPEPGKPHTTVSYRKGLPRFDYRKLTTHWVNPTRQMVDITATTQLKHLHEENDFIEFNREPLIPHMVSSEGPALAVADINKDGLEDIFIGSAKGKKSAVYLQNTSGQFVQSSQPALDADSTYEDVDAAWVDLNNDGFTDLVVASGGNEYFGQDEHLLSRVYLNDGKGNFRKLDHAIDGVYATASCVVPCDFNGDGFADLFIGGRTVPWEYGQIPQSYLLQNDGTGRFTDVTVAHAKELQHIGMVTQGIWFDIDKDGDQDLIIATEWGGIYAFINNKGQFVKKTISDKKGWWNFILPCDIDNDGDIDLVAGNLGLNSRLKASEKEPVRLYYNDFDGNGKKEQVMTYYLDGRELPFATKDELQRQMPLLKKKFLYAADFAKASLKEIFTEEKLKGANTLSADYFANAVLINDGKMNFTAKTLPWQAQLAPYRDALVVDANHDNLPDILLVGNFYDNNIQMGRYDADYGTILVNKGNGSFDVQPFNGLQVKGQIRHIRKIRVGKKDAFIIARNNDSAMIIRFADKR